MPGPNQIGETNVNVSGLLISREFQHFFDTHEFSSSSV
jgi:hypothetical protein